MIQTTDLSARAWRRDFGRVMSTGWVVAGLLFLFLRWQSDALGALLWLQHLPLYSIAAKYAWVIPDPLALSVGLSIAMLSGSAIGALFGISRRAPIAQSPFRGLSNWRKAGYSFLLLGIVVLPYLDLASYDAASRSDRRLASFLESDILAAIFVGATFVGYAMIFAALMCEVRRLLRPRLGV